MMPRNSVIPFRLIDKARATRALQSNFRAAITRRVIPDRMVLVPVHRLSSEIPYNPKSLITCLTYRHAGIIRCWSVIALRRDTT
jgi:hypothetical protein